MIVFLSVMKYVCFSCLKIAHTIYLDVKLKCFLGNAGVGKTCLVRKFTQGIFPPGQSATIGVDFMIKTVKVGDDKIKLQIW